MIDTADILARSREAYIATRAPLSAATIAEIRAGVNDSETPILTAVRALTDAALKNTGA